MEYLKVNDVDLSRYVNKLSITTQANYNAQTNANGNSVVDMINKKRTIKVGFIPVNANTMISILSEIEKFNVSVSFRNPYTNTLEESVNCIAPNANIEYFTINIKGVSYNAFSIDFIEL